MSAESFHMVELARGTRLAAAGKWEEFWKLARERIEQSTALQKKYVELPVAVRTRWENYGIVSGALEALGQGWFQDASILSDATYTDSRVSACLNTRVNALFGLPLIVEPQGQNDPQDPDDPIEQEIQALKKEVAAVIKQKLGDMLPSSPVREFQRWGVMVNLGLGELEWDWYPCSLVEAGEIFMPVLKTWNPQFVYWRWDTRSFWLVHTDGQLEITPGDGHWVLNCPTGHNHGWLYGAIRALGKLWLDRVFWQQDYARVEEKFALGIIKAYEPADGDPEDKQRFENIITDMPSEATVLLPRNAEGIGFDLEVMEVPGIDQGAPLLQNRGAAINDDIAILLLGQNLTTSAGTAGTGGSRALGEVQDVVRKDYVKADNDNLTAVTTQQILYPFVERNWKSKAESLGVDWRELVPLVTRQTEPEEDKGAAATAFGAMATGLVALVSQIGAPIDVRAMLQQADVPLMPEGETEHTGLVQPPDFLPSQKPPPAPPGKVGPDGKPIPGGGGPPKPNMPGAKPGPGGEVVKQSILADVELSRAPRHKAIPPGHKPGGAAAQAYVDRIATALREKAEEAIAAKRDEVIAICKRDDSYLDRRKALLELYRGTHTPRELRAILKHALVLTNLAGRYSVAVDTRKP